MSASNKRNGATSVEFAMVLPVMLILVFGSVELTRISMLRHTANHAAYVAARDAIVPGASTANAISSAEEHLSAVGINDAVVEISPATITEDTRLVEVTVSFPVASNSLVVPEFSSGNIVGQSSMITERSNVQMSESLPTCLLYTSPSPRDKRQTRMPSSA